MALLLQKAACSNFMYYSYKGLQNNHEWPVRIDQGCPIPARLLVLNSPRQHL